jgi:nucleoid DNA-binding protein
MTKAELIERIARSRSLPKDITKKDIEKIVTLAFEEIASYFAKAKVTRTQSPKFSFPHFGTFVKKRRSARRGVNPRTLEPMTIEAFYSLDFRNSSELRDAMNRARIEAEPSTRRAKRATSEPDAVELAATDTDRATAVEPDERLPAAPLQRVRAATGGGRVRSA